MHALLIGDRPADRRLLHAGARVGVPGSFKSEVVAGFPEAVRRLAAGGIDVILLDLGLAEGRADLFPGVREASLNAPILVLADPDEEPLALQAVRDGAETYLIRGKCDGRSLVREIAIAIERHGSTVACRDSNEQLKRILDSTAEATCATDLSGRCTFCNDSAAKLLGYSGGDSIVGQDIHALVQHTRADGSLYPREECRIIHAIARGHSLEAEDEVFWRADGTSFPVGYRSNPLFCDGAVVGGVVSFEDLTSHQEAEVLGDERRRLTTFSTTLGRALTRGGALRDVLGRCAEEMVQHLNATIARIWTLDSEAQVLELQASSGESAQLHGPRTKLSLELSRIGRIASGMKPHCTNGVMSRLDSEDDGLGCEDGSVGFAAYPLVVEGELYGIMALSSRRPFSETTLRALASASEGISIFAKRKRADHSRKLTEEQRRQSQTMDALGRLAGGIACEFNDLLTVIIGFGELAIREAPPQGTLARHLSEIHAAAGRAASLTRELLAFGGRQVVHRRVLNPNHVIRNLEAMLLRVADASIEMRLELDPATGNTRADNTELDQILMNLTVNARDAMPAGGTLTIASTNAEVNDSYRDLYPDLVPGRYVVITVRDTGVGMDEERLRRVFEPFFTTKENTESSGLGLSVLYGIVKQSGGSIRAFSEVGHGTSMKVYLPRVEDPLEESKPRQESPAFYRGSECVLLVEDDEALRGLARVMLEQQGYQVLEAASPEEAITLARARESEIDLTLTDVILPGMSGQDLVVELRAVSPGIRVLYMSGYARELMTNDGVLGTSIDFLEKPFTSELLARKVREILDRERPAPPCLSLDLAPSGAVELPRIGE